MSVVAFASIKSSPGTTTALVAAGHVWPAERAVLVVEADPAGGDLAARYGLGPEPGLASLAAAGRRALAPEILAKHTQEAAGLSILLAPATGGPTRAALEVLGTSLGSTLARLKADVLVDCGRLEHDSPALPLARAADLLVLIARPTVAELPRVAARVAELAAEGLELGLILVGEASPLRRDRYPAGEVAEVVRVRVLGTLADDGQGAGLLSGGPGSARALERSVLVRSARDVVEALLTRLRSLTSPATGAHHGDAPPPWMRRRPAAWVGR